MEVWKKISPAMFCVFQFRSLVIRPLRELSEDIQFVWQVWDFVWQGWDFVWQVWDFVWQVWDFVWQKLWNAIFDLAVGSVHLQLSSRSLATIVVYLLRGALSFFNALLGDDDAVNQGSTQAKLFSAGLLVAVVAVDLVSGLLVGSISATISLLLVSAFIYAGSPAQVKENFHVPVWMLCLYNLTSGLVAVMLTIHSYLGLAPETYAMLISALLLVQKSRHRGRLSWSDDVLPVVGWAFCIFALWKIPFALAMAIHLDSWVSFQTASNLFCACFVMTLVEGSYPSPSPGMSKGEPKTSRAGESKTSRADFARAGKRPKKS